MCIGCASALPTPASSLAVALTGFKHAPEEEQHDIHLSRSSASTLCLHFYGGKSGWTCFWKELDMAEQTQTTEARPFQTLSATQPLPAPHWSCRGAPRSSAACMDGSLAPAPCSCSLSLTPPGTGCCAAPPTTGAASALCSPWLTSPRISRGQGHPSLPSPARYCLPFFIPFGLRGELKAARGGGWMVTPKEAG